MNQINEIEIRLARFDEAAVVSKLIFHAFEDKRSFYTEAAFALTTPSTSEIEERIKNKMVWVAVKDGSVVGTISACTKGESWYIRSLAVDKDRRRLGIAEMLMRHMEKLGLANDHKYLKLTTCNFLEPACELYASLGFIHDGFEDLAGTELIRLKKILNPFSSKIKLQKHDHIK